MEYRHLLKSPVHRKVWGGAFGKEVGRLIPGLPGVVEGTTTIGFIQNEDAPPDRWHDVTYPKIVCSFRQKKSNTQYTTSKQTSNNKQAAYRKQK